MSYFLIGEMPVGDDPLFVLWTRSPSGVQVLSMGSRDRRDMQAIGRQLIDVAAPTGDLEAMLELIVAGAPQRADGEALRLVDLDAAQREAIARSISE